MRPLPKELATASCHMLGVTYCGPVEAYAADEAIAADCMLCTWPDADEMLSGREKFGIGLSDTEGTL